MKQMNNHSQMTGIFISDGTKSTGLGSLTARTQLVYKDYNIVLYTTGEVYLFDNEYNVLLHSYLYINNTQTVLQTIDIDNEGKLYGITVYNNQDHLVYMNNITEKNVSGEYTLELRQNYNLNSMLSSIGADTGAPLSINKIMLKKSPLDSRFIIILDGHTSGSTVNNLVVINYHVNFGSDNTYEYRVTKVGSYNWNSTQSVYTSWTDDNVSVYMFSINSTYQSIDYYNASAVGYYYNTVTFSEGSSISKTQIHSSSSSILTGIIAGGIVKGVSDIWFIDGAKNTSTQAITTKLYHYKNGILTNKYQISGYAYSTTNLLLTDNQLFIGLFPRTSNTEPYTHQISLFHIIGDNYVSLLDYEGPFYTSLMLIMSSFNLYSINVNDYRYKYIYNSTGYNGIEYFSDNSVTSGSTTLYGINKDGSRNIVPIFSRNLYNKAVVGNSITSTVQIPYGYLNNSIITEEQLFSKSNNIIDYDFEEFEKNQYEEMYINNIDSYKVFDNNIGSAYNQKSTLTLVDNIINGFEDKYKITHYRINYKNGTYKEHPINHITRTGQNAEITIYVRNEDVLNVELYDSNFTCPFVTIDMQDYELNKIYKITEHVKVE